ncbi:peptidoglycan DD-metalloendopeptidase family protein [Thermoflavimicrobium daqui]|uniref:Uncharacterized protein n=1 Tax=Thermoflavimicrobium daqui TaxID=2137476 RepID=A0A364K562_9BACL|nr:peptidoglycan DD-metalloendopeptidase family protein [Thermoflavimicrobium daqui]RAL24524.1 hypothetical protein DL897_09450 [Thermoflavimicrobium daqui]
MKQKLIACALTMSLALSVGVSGVSFAEENSSKKKVEKKKEDLKQIREDKNKKKEELDQSSEEKEKLEKEIEEIEKDLKKVNSQLEEQGKKLINQKKQVEEKQKKFNKTIRRMYQKGEFGYMSQLLAADSFGEFLNRFESLRLIVKEDNTVVKDYRKELEKIQKTQDQIEKLKKEREPKLKETQKKLETVTSKMKDVASEYKLLAKKEEMTEEELNEIKKLISTGSGSYSGGKLAYPTVMGRISSNFGEFRGSYSHKGIDFPRPVGTPIYAAAAGTVIRAGSSSGFGNVIIIDHGNGLATWYGHMYASGIYVHTGQKVSRGQTIGAVGNAGQSSGPHLHFEVRINNAPRNPMGYIR